MISNKTVASGHQEMISVQKWVLAILFATFGAKFWMDGFAETRIRNQVEAGDNRLERKIDELETRMKEHIISSLKMLRLEISNDRLEKEGGK
ncbi:hypothetical protein HOY82DRAFT_612012 [Tuber indicum]|nr:hypothetical protein HOY82DRAFT_612012 [Tuber indicum]